MVATGVTIFVFLWAFHLAREDADEKIQKNAWKTFPPNCSEDSCQEASLERMNDYLYRIVERIPKIKALSLKFLWDDSKEDNITGVAFGFRNQKYICLRKGLHPAFIKLSQSEQPDLFHPIVLHELGHLENHDVSKTIFSLALTCSFFRTTLIILFLFDIYWLWALIENIVGNRALDAVWDGGSVIASVNLKAILLMLLVEIIRSSILRVREYYADARARAWIGNCDDFFSLFKPCKKSSKYQSSSQKYEEGQQIVVIGLWKLFSKKFHHFFAPFHPTTRQRINVLLNPHRLFKPSYEVAFFAGLLSSLSLNSSFLIAIVSTELLDFLVDSVDTTSTNWFVLITGLLILVATLLVFIILTLVLTAS